MKLDDILILKDNPTFKTRMFNATGKVAQEMRALAPRKEMIKGYIEGKTNYKDVYLDDQEFKFKNNEEYNKAVKEYLSLERTLIEITEPSSKTEEALQVERAATNGARVLKDLIDKKKVGGLKFPVDATEEQLTTFAKDLPEVLLYTLSKRLITGKVYRPEEIV